MSSRREMLAFLSLSRLPSAFQEVEYLESTGTQYIDSGTQITADIKVNVQFLLTQLGSGANESAITSNGSYGSNCFLLLSTGSRLMFFGGGWTISSATDRNIVYNVELTKSYAVLDGTTVAFSGTDYGNGTLILLHSQDRGFYGKLYSCRIYDNNTLVRDFVPCYRKADNVAGLYDLANGIFYTNAGTGDFIVGGNV